MCIYIYIAANLRSKILDLRGLDSSIISILRGGIITSIGNFLDMLNQAILVAIILAGRSGVCKLGWLPTIPVN